MTTTAEIMAKLPDRFRSEMAGNYQATIQFKLMGHDGGEWILSIAAGACSVREGQADQPTAIVTMDAGEFVGINTGEVSAVEVFWSGRIEVQGEMDAVIALQSIMDWR